MSITQRFASIKKLKFSFSKSTEFSKAFARESHALSMYDKGYGLGIPANLSAENQLRGVFGEVSKADGVFLFNISGVNLKMAKKGFSSFQLAEMNNQLTEWELSMILNNREYLKRCNFHNGSIVFKKRILWKSVM